VWRAGLYQFTANLTRGVHTISIAFTNDYYEPPEDRNLYVYYVLVREA